MPKRKIGFTLCPLFFNSGSIRSKRRNLPEFFTKSSSTLEEGEKGEKQLYIRRKDAKGFHHSEASTNAY